MGSLNETSVYYLLDLSVQFSSGENLNRDFLAFTKGAVIPLFKVHNNECNRFAVFVTNTAYN